jgi:hypothetical protein
VKIVFVRLAVEIGVTGNIMGNIIQFINQPLAKLIFTKIETSIVDNQHRYTEKDGECNAKANRYFLL